MLSALATLGMLQAQALASAIASSIAQPMGPLAYLSAAAASSLFWALVVHVSLIHPACTTTNIHPPRGRCGFADVNDCILHERICSQLLVLVARCQ